LSIAQRGSEKKLYTEEPNLFTPGFKEFGYSGTDIQFTE